MTKPIDVAKEPCSSCPYRRDVPSGLWHRSEYKKLPEYDEGAEPPSIALFLCHQTNATGRETVCRGWLSVHRNSIAVRLALMQGNVTEKQVRARVATELHESGDAACAAGLLRIRRPGKDAEVLREKLLQKGAGSLDEKPKRRRRFAASRGRPA